MPNDLTLTIIDTTGIQRYVFGSNKLQHNVGASYLVECATGAWVDEEAKTLGQYSIAGSNGEIEGNDTVLAEKIYSGGGNTVILFRTRVLAEQFTYALTKKVLLEAPGLQLVITHKQFQWGASLAKAVQDLIKQANSKKARLVPSTPMLGLGVTADCDYTGIPAVALEEKDETGEDSRRISAEAEAKVKAAKLAHTALISKLSALPKGRDIPKNFDQFGRSTGESSYIAIVHADGNGMGERIKKIANEHNTPSNNRAYIRAIHAFSESIRSASEEAMNSLIQHLCERIEEEKIGGKIALAQEGGSLKLPFRPLVMGGDDVTFVCDGRLGLSLATLYLQTVQKKVLADNAPLWSRAGVAVVKNHYPFARAYALAEDLCKKAKTRTTEVKKDQKRDAYMLDWHFAVSGAVRPLDEIHEREYQVDKRSLRMRPLDVIPTQTDWRTWQTFEAQLKVFGKEGWADKRNKVKALREALRAGPEEVMRFLQAYSRDNDPLQLPIIQGQDTANGYAGSMCAYFDAIEALDFYVPLA